MNAAAVRFLQVAIVCSGSLTYAFPRVCYDYPFQYVTRQEWGADPPRSVTRLSTPVPYVIIHHTYIPAICMTADRCKQDMKSMQRTHQVTNGWADIGYNFAVGGEGSVLEGRGWETQGAHAAGWNARSIGIVLIGNFVSARPTDVQIRAAQDLIKVGVDLGFIAHNYMLIGHRQAVATECPGNALFNEIRTWSNFVNNV